LNDSLKPKRMITQTQSERAQAAHLLRIEKKKRRRYFLSYFLPFSYTPRYALSSTEYRMIRCHLQMEVFGTWFYENGLVGLWRIKKIGGIIDWILCISPFLDNSGPPVVWRSSLGIQLEPLFSLITQRWIAGYKKYPSRICRRKHIWKLVCDFMWWKLLIFVILPYYHFFFLPKKIYYY